MGKCLKLIVNDSCPIHAKIISIEEEINSLLVGYEECEEEAPHGLVIAAHHIAIVETQYREYVDNIEL